MSRTEILLLEVVNEASHPYTAVRNSGEALADEIGYMFIEKPYNLHTCETWRELDLLGIKKAVVAVKPPENHDLEFMYQPAIELWFKKGTQWVVSVSNYGGWD